MSFAAFRRREGSQLTQRARSALLAVLVVSALVGLAVPAGAHVTNLRDFFTIEGDCLDGTACDRIVWNTVYGTITCTAGENFRVAVKIVQKEGPGRPGYIARGQAKGTCTGSEQDWAAELHDRGYVQCDVPYIVTGRAMTFVDGVQHGAPVTQRTTNTWDCAL